MSEISKYEAQVKKMQALCEEHELVYRFDKYRYPMIFTIRPTQSGGEQLSMLEKDEEEAYTSPDAYMKWQFQNNELRQVVDGGAFTIDVTLRKKIETILLKMITFWLQYFFRDVIIKGSLKRGMMPVINEDDAGAADEASDQYDDDEDEDDEPEIEIEEDEEGGDDDEEADSLIEQATQIVRAENKATVSLLQRRMNIGYAQASRLMDRLEDKGVVGPFNGNEPRAVLPCDVPDDEAV